MTKELHTELTDLTTELREIEASMKYCEVKGRQDWPVYKKLEERSMEIKSIILNIR